MSQAGVEVLAVLVVVIVLLAVATCGLAYKLTQKNKKALEAEKKLAAAAATPAASPEYQPDQPQWQQQRAMQEQVPLKAVGP